MLDNAHIESPLANDDDLISKLQSDERRRRKKVTRIEVKLYRVALQLGQTPQQARDKVEALFRTYIAETSLFLLLGTDDLATAINADATLPWLNVTVGGKTIRQHLVAQLSN